MSGLPETVLAELVGALGEDAVVTDPDILAAHSHDRASFCAAGVPAVLLRPRITDEVQRVMRIAHRHRVPVVPQGARTGLSGAANAVDGSILLSLARMNRILEIDTVNHLAVVEAGVVNSVLSEAVAEKGLFYPPDPSSWRESTIGGNIATNAGGLCCVKYGVTRQYVRQLEVVLADGELVTLGSRTAKGVAGLDLVGLMVGSEGTLGIITKAVLALRPAPRPALTAAALFTSPSAAMAAVEKIMSSSIQPSLLEFLDGVTVRAVQAYRDMGLPPEAEAMLIAQSDAADAARLVTEMAGICREAGAVEVAETDDPKEAEMLLEARRLVNPAVERLGTTLIEDVAVPRSRLVEFVEELGRIAERRKVIIACPGHVGDGNLHPTIIFDRNDEQARDRALLAFDDVMAAGLAVGGTITGEHGVGMLKRSWLSTELGPRVTALQVGIKRIFDPQGILNPGKVW
ncbi:FAD-linked oxidase [Thermopolyspora flexuosa]|uniref:Glycolate oxidase n=1 Tax=Thermopolyspora flexuosa TaxID=103836 RepID=A0A543IYL6_9ACTN|nr:FAD-linked oxidase C-terminal domain-containing protein [Thermopolyspora flexuosa]TQM75668.1 glycolate oxidase [Thermopolyspora flexuosa]GGM61074.1 FAD-linked oxidase [Thermopolyspora flexuosa]